MQNFTFLTVDQIYGDEKLEIIKKYGLKAAITDYSILRGGYVSSDNSFVIDSVNRTGLWWTKTKDDKGGVYAVGEKLKNRVTIPIINPAKVAINTAELLISSGLCHSKLTYPIPDMSKLYRSVLNNI